MPGDGNLEDRVTVVARQFAAGAAVVIAAGFAIKVIFLGSPHTGAALAMAVVCGLVAAFLTDWRAQTGVAIVAIAAFVGFAAPATSPLTDDPSAWPYLRRRLRLAQS